MPGVLKRGATAAANHGKANKKVKLAVPPASDEDDSASEEDSEVNEFELGDADENDDEDDDDDMIGDDDEDLYANLGGSGDGSLGEDGSDDAEEQSDEGDSSAGSEAEEPTATVEPAAKRRGVSKKAPVLKPEELRALAFAELTASPISSVLSSSVSTLLRPSTPPSPATSPLQPLLKQLHSHITSLSPVKPTSLQAMRKRGVVVPPVEGLDGKWGGMDLSWDKPRQEDVRIVGKWAWGGGSKTKGEYVVDMAVALPATLLQPKDYMVPRFAVKATHYLVTLASRLPESLGPITLSYTLLPGSHLYALEIRAAPVAEGQEKTGLQTIKGAVLRLRVVWPTDAFPHSKLSPLSNLSRPSNPQSSNDVSTVTFPPTPCRATALHFASLNLLTTHLKFHHALATTHGASYTGAVRLLQAWANKRGYASELGFSSEWWAWCVARTLAWGNASPSSSGVGEDGTTDGGSAWAVWRKAVEWLGGVKWTEGVWFRVEGDQAYEKDDFRKAFAGKAIFGDPTGTVNLAGDIDLSTLEMLKQDARTTISLLLAGTSDEAKFESAFRREMRPTERFDNYARITVPASAIKAEQALDSPSAIQNLVKSISATLRRALGNRVIAFQLNASPSADIQHKGPTTEAPLVLSLGLLLDPVQSARLVDQGPSAEDEAACADFRSFWGSKSELRRFKDGSILESVVWEDESQGSSLGPQRNKVVSHILKHILPLRHSIPAANIHVFAAAMDHLIVEPEGVRRAIFLEDAVATGKGFGSVMATFDNLSKELKDLNDLPLAVSAVQPTGPGLRYSTVFTPSPRRLKNFDRFPESTKYIEMHDIQLTLEGSGRWPDDLVGVQKIKAAFLSRIAEGLAGLHTVVDARVAFDTDCREMDDNVSLEILTATGFAFRARIFYERSLTLLAEREAQLGPIASTSTSSLDLFNKRFVHLPRHHAAISTLQHQFVAYSPTVRLVKRWFSTHMLLSSFPPELLELLTASVFLDPLTPHETPASGATGFARVLERLATWKWRDAPLVVPLYSYQGAVSSGRRPTIPTHHQQAAISSFERKRLADPTINEYAWIIATEEDDQGLVWGRQTDRLAAARVKVIAKAALESLNDGLLRGILNVDQLFVPPLADYHFLVHLDAAKDPRHFQSLQPDPKALASRSSDVVAGSFAGGDSSKGLLLEWDPVLSLIKAIQSLYPSALKLFHAEGSAVIGGVWLPEALGDRAWKVDLGFPSRPGTVEGDKAKVHLDKEAILREVARLGRGLIKKIENRT